MEPGTETKQDPLAGLKPGRIVYFVFDDSSAAEVNRRRTSGSSIAERIKVLAWPVGAQAHIGTPIAGGDVFPAMVIRHHGSGNCNLKVMLDGTDDYWATSAHFDPGTQTPGTEEAPAAVVFGPRTWHWMFDGQNTRYSPDRVETA